MDADTGYIAAGLALLAVVVVISLFPIGLFTGSMLFLVFVGFVLGLALAVYGAYRRMNHAK